MTWLLRLPNHLGDAVLALPALEAARRRGNAVIAAREPAASLAHLAGAKVFKLPQGRIAELWAARKLAQQGPYEEAVLLTPSFSARLGARLAGSKKIHQVQIGAPGHRADVYMTLVNAVEIAAGPAGPRNDGPGEVLAATSLKTIPRLNAAPGLAGALLKPIESSPRPWLIFAPGSRASSRRWPVERFAELARAIGKGTVIVVGTAEDSCAGQSICEAARQAGRPALSLAGRTTMNELAGALKQADLVVSNDSGVMHLAAALGVKTLSFWGAGDPERTGPRSLAALRLVRHAELDCVPCLKNQCPRKGPGTFLKEAEKECLSLITASEAKAAIEELLGR